jgi:predicted RNA-binding Zn-ribbon protein involved in translation (DUF1610 family)
VIAFKCRVCGSRLSVEDDLAGETVECPRCAAELAAPRPDAPPARPVADAPRPSVRDRPWADADADDDPDDPPARRVRRRRYPCPHCGSTAVPIVKRRISTTGWIVFTVLLVFTICFFWVGLLIREDYRVCPECGIELP